VAEAKDVRKFFFSLLASCLEMEYVGCWYCDCKGGEKTQVETAKEVENEDDMAADIIRKLREKKRREESTQVMHIAA